MGNCMCKSSKGGTLVEKRDASPYSPPAPPPSKEQSREQSQEQIMPSDAAPRIATPIPNVSAFDDEIVTVGDVRYIPSDVRHPPWEASSSHVVDALEIQMENGIVWRTAF
ncbi:hypothetical protein NW752_004388 [Fusarium irregulare]|uniref:Uncharacterized protein n=1 Tax=Fusarium irregulare TaxID=2494466 RepID=A0A9W8U9D0_9HYPO|nr:hypothetical protein NW766_007295 [Fusarium irregulare]KAJ4021380.1 hypothetical protein NW752_004388 [Fusarium irregulare]